jgi:hypothetical protein
MNMPIESKKQSKAKSDWMRDNSKVYGVRVMINTERDLYDFLQRQTVPAATVIKQALREYMTNHPAE